MGMQTIIPPKLNKGDKIRVIAPSFSFSIISKENRRIAKKRLNDLGLKVTFGKNIEKTDLFNSSSIASRITDLHQAFIDQDVKAVLTVIGGYNSNQLLQYINWNLIKKNPKIFCGFSDITVLQNAILSKTGLVTYSGPHYSSFAEQLNFEYTKEYFIKCLMSTEAFLLSPSPIWSDDLWYENQKQRHFLKNNGWRVINKGKAEGTIVGGNLCSFNLLQGTEYFPSLTNSVLFIEDDSSTNPLIFDRNLQSLIQQKGLGGVRGLVIGRFQKQSKITDHLLDQIIATKKELAKIPVISNVDFGHTQPIITFPIGGKVILDCTLNRKLLKILDH